MHGMPYFCCCEDIAFKNHCGFVLSRFIFICLFLSLSIISLPSSILFSVSFFPLLLILVTPFIFSSEILKMLYVHWASFFSFFPPYDWASPPSDVVQLFHWSNHDFAAYYCINWVDPKVHLGFSVRYYREKKYGLTFWLTQSLFIYLG